MRRSFCWLCFSSDDCRCSAHDRIVAHLKHINAKSRPSYLGGALGGQKPVKGGGK